MRHARIQPPGNQWAQDEPNEKVAQNCENGRGQKSDHKGAWQQIQKHHHAPAGTAETPDRTTSLPEQIDEDHQDQSGGDPQESPEGKADSRRFHALVK
jgi:hypothetical protein